MSLNVLVVDDHKIMRDGIKVIVAASPKYQVVADASDGKEAIEQVKQLKIDLIVMDINMPNLDGVSCTKKIMKLKPDMKILAMSMHVDEQHIINMLQAGAKGYISKNAGKVILLEALDAVSTGEIYYGEEIQKTIMSQLSKSKEEKIRDNPADYLTAREIDILQLIVDEKSNFEIADLLNISQRTVDSHRRNILIKTGLKNAVGLTKFAIKHGLVD